MTLFFQPNDNLLFFSSFLLTATRKSDAQNRKKKQHKQQNTMLGKKLNKKNLTVLSLCTSITSEEPLPLLLDFICFLESYTTNFIREFSRKHNDNNNFLKKVQMKFFFCLHTLLFF